MDATVDYKENLKNIIKNIPETPGCYQYYDEKGEIIYVGKAKNLKRRVSSYFTKSHDNSPKTRILVRKIRDIKYIVVDTEEDTLLLENNLIKELQPRYNIRLKDDKTYASIVIRNEFFPRVEQTRNIIKNGSLYFGPYSNGLGLKIMLQTLHKLYPLRTCKYTLLPNEIAEGKYKPCLEFHIKRCKAPCIALQSEEEYLENIESIKEILKGNTSIVLDQIYSKMMDFANKQDFEKAHELKEKYKILESFKQKSTVVTNINYNIDIFGYDEDESAAYINYMSVNNGAIIKAYTFEYSKGIEEEKEELLSTAIIEMRERFDSKAKEVIVPFIPELTTDKFEFTTPQRGDKAKLLKLSIQNVKQYKVDKLKKAETLNPEQRNTRIIKEIQNDLHLKELPIQIECFDNSNIQGTNPVSACVVFIKGKPAKKMYRHFNVKTVEGPDDFSTMREAVYRRYHRLLEESAPLPQLIVIDGGKGQLSAACESLKELNLYGKIAIIGLAERLEEIYFPEDPIPLYLDKNSDSMKVILHLRDEAHRFGLAFHRNKRSKQQTESELDKIKGIGEKTKAALLKHFKSVKRLKNSNLEEIKEVIGQNKAEIIWEYIQKSTK